MSNPTVWHLTDSTAAARARLHQRVHPSTTTSCRCTVTAATTPGLSELAAIERGRRLGRLEVEREIVRRVAASIAAGLVTESAVVAALLGPTPAAPTQSSTGTDATASRRPNATTPVRRPTPAKQSAQPKAFIVAR